MNALCWYVLVVSAIAVVLKLVYLAKGEYPRSEERSALTDAVGMLVSVGLGAWAAILLFGGAR